MSDLWSDPANWSNGLPNADQKAIFSSTTVPVCVMDIAGAQAKQLAVGDNSGGSLKLVAGDLTVMDWSIVGYAQGNTGDQAGHLIVEGGVLNCQARLFIGFQGEGDLTVDKDGVVNVYNQASGIGQEKTGNGSLYVKGGTINFWAGGASLGLVHRQSPHRHQRRHPDAHEQHTESRYHHQGDHRPHHYGV